MSAEHDITENFELTPHVAPADATGVDIVTFGLEEDSLSRTLLNRGLVAAKGEEWANIQRSLSLAETRMMNRPADEPMLCVKRLTRAANDSVVEYVETLLDADYFGLRMEF